MQILFLAPLCTYLPVSLQQPKSGGSKSAGVLTEVVQPACSSACPVCRPDIRVCPHASSGESGDTPSDSGGAPGIYPGHASHSGEGLLRHGAAGGRL